MICDFPTGKQPGLVFMLILNFIGFLLAIVANICIMANTSIDQSLRGILLSFSIANFLGTGMTTYDSFYLICVGHHFLDFAITISMTLSVTHMMLLILTEYISLTGSWKQRARDHTGLLLISWIISVTFGSMNLVTIGNEAKMTFVILFILSLILMLKAFISVKIKHKKRKCLLIRYKRTFLRPNLKKQKVLKRSWKTNLLGFIIISYVIFSVPWILNELNEGLGPHDSQTLFHHASLISYSVQYYFPSIVCIYLRYIQQKVSSKWRLRRYRYRDSVV